MNIKKLGIALMLLVSILLAVAPAYAANYQVDKVEVDGIDATSGVVYVERGEDVDIDVFLRGTGSTTDVRVRAWIGGYEYDEVEAKTKMFEVENGVVYKKSLTLELPEDLDSSKDYTLRVEIFDDLDEVRYTYTVRVQETRHLLDIQKVYFRDQTNIEAGRPLFTTVRIENMGDNVEEDIEISVAIPSLGVEAIGYIDELQVGDTESNVGDSSSNDEIYLRIPQDAKTGVYDVVVTLSYDRGHSEVSVVEQVAIKGVEETSTAADSLVVRPDATLKEVAQGKGVVYRIALANVGSQAGTYSAEVEGVEWGNARVDPSEVTLQPDQIGELFVYVSANENAAAGRHNFNVNIKSGETVLGQLNLGADVVKQTSATGWETVRKALVYGFVALAVILVILGLVIAFNKVRKGDEGEEQATAQTYY